MLWKRASTASASTRIAQAAEPSEPTSSVDPRDFDRALGALAALVRLTSRYALDAPNQPANRVAQLAEDWAQHILIQRQKPGDSRPSKGRDYNAVVQFVNEHRKSEHEFVLASLADFRDTVWAFIHSLNRALAEDESSDETVSEQLSRLKDAAQNGSTEQLKQAAMSTAQSIGNIVESRQRKQAERNGELGRRLASLGRQLEDARRKSEIDPLTQLHNRGAFDAYLAQLIELSKFVSQGSSLLLIDVDHFKRVNDTFGHPAGDDVLKRIAECLVRTFLRKNDLVARYGGEEFAVVLPETSQKDALMLGERFRAALAKVEFPSVQGSPITVSIGVSTTHAKDDVGSWLKRADRALYDAKNSGRNRTRPGI